MMMKYRVEYWMRSEPKHAVHASTQEEAEDLAEKYMRGVPYGRFDEEYWYNLFPGEHSKYYERQREVRVYKITEEERRCLEIEVWEDIRERYYESVQEQSE